MHLREYFTRRYCGSLGPSQPFHSYYQNIVSIGLRFDRLIFTCTDSGGFNLFSFSFTSLLFRLGRGVADCDLVNWPTFHRTVAAFRVNQAEFALMTLVQMPRLF